MCVAAPIIMMAMSAASAGISAVSAMNQADAAQQVASNNAQMAEYAAQDAQRRGEQDAMAIQRKGAAVKSSQRVALASKGLDLSYGTAADLQDQTDFFAQSDTATARDNAAREAWSLRARGQAERAKGDFAASNGMLSAAGSLIGGAGQVASRWYAHKNPSGYDADLMRRGL